MLTAQQLKSLTAKARAVEPPVTKRRGRPTPNKGLYAQVRPLIVELLGKGLSPSDAADWLNQNLETPPSPRRSPAWWRWYYQARKAQSTKLT